MNKLIKRLLFKKIAAMKYSGKIYLYELHVRQND